MQTRVLWGSIGIVQGLRDPSIQIIATLGPKVSKHYLHWAIWIRRESYG